MDNRYIIALWFTLGVAAYILATIRELIENNKTTFNPIVMAGVVAVGPFSLILVIVTWLGSINFTYEKK